MNIKEPTLLSLLADGRFHSGEYLGKTLNISRSAIWKQIQKLQKRGINVQSIRGKGYNIPQGLSLLDPNLIYQQLSAPAKSALSPLQCLDSIDSTNHHLLQQINCQKPQVIACFAEQQTAGKGRRGRQWHSPYANNIYHSLLWYFKKDPGELMGLSLVIAVLVARSLQAFGITAGLELKWPNDIHWQSHKLGGILIEMQAEPHESCAVVIGIGINTRIISQNNFNHPATSTEAILAAPSDRNRLAALLLNHLIAGLTEFQAHGMKSFLNEWQRLDSFQEKMVTLMSSQHEFTGIMKGISERGELLLEDTQGRISAHLSGDLSLRKIKCI
jgi:BirA family transcriptional regulator, biotin operon repressor / biotin---[acetyl-CoA-carboxylase] ligase